jgi:undecaprenyl-diphosphatase
MLVVIFIVLTVVVELHLTMSLDQLVLVYFRSLQGNIYLDTVMITVTSLADVFTLVIIAMVLTVIRRTRKIGMICLITIVIIAIIVMYIKPLIGRSAPPYKFSPSLKLPNHFTIEDDSIIPFARSFSYPSNHIAIATAFTFILGFRLNRNSHLAGLLIWFFPVAIAFTKLYIMQHYLTDAISAFVLGLIVSVVLSNTMGLDKPFLMSRFKGKEEYYGR